MANDLMKQYQQQKRADMLTRFGQGLIQAGSRGAGLLSGVAQGVGGAAQGGGGLLDMLRLQQFQQAGADRTRTQGREDRQDFARQAISTNRAPAGLDPRTGVDWRTSRNLLPTERKGLLSEAYPEQVGRAVVDREFPKPETLPPGMRLGPDGQPEVIPGYVGLQGDIAEAKRAPNPQYGAVQFDQAVGKHYQTNPESGKREYVSSPSGMEITTPDGTTIKTGVPRGGGGGMRPSTQADIEKGLRQAYDGIARLKDVAAKFKPEYQEIPTRVGHAITGLKSWVGLDISSADQGSYATFIDQQRGAIDNTNQYIKDMTGATVGKEEAPRLKLGIPDPGAGVFSGDNPIAFEAKLHSTIESLQKAAARAQYYLERGISNPDKMAKLTPLDGMKIFDNPETGESVVSIDGQWVPLP